MLRASSIEINQVQSFVLNDDDDEDGEKERIKEIETDNQSTSDTIIAADEIEAVLNKTESQDVSPALIANTESRELEKNMYVRANSLEGKPGMSIVVLSRHEDPRETRHRPRSTYLCQRSSRKQCTNTRAWFANLWKRLVRPSSIMMWAQSLARAIHLLASAFSIHAFTPWNRIDLLQWNLCKFVVCLHFSPLLP